MKLPVLAIVREAYVFLWQRRATFWPLAIPGIVLLAIVSALVNWLSVKITGHPGGLSGSLEGVGANPSYAGALLLLTLAYAVVYFAILVLYSVAWHRAFLVPGESVTIGSAYRWRKRQTQFLFAYLKLFGVIVGVVGVVGVVIGITTAAATSEASILIIQLGYALAGGLIFSRLSMLFPATAVDRHMTLKEGWRFTRGNTWRLFGIGLMVAVPIALISVPFNILIGLLAVSTGVGGSLTGNLILTLMYHFLAFVGIAVGVTALSISYRRLTAGGAPPATA